VEEKYALVSRVVSALTTLLSPSPPPPRQTQPPFSRYMRTPACRNKVLHGAQGLDQGRVEGGKHNKAKCKVRYRSDKYRHPHVACVPLQLLAAAQDHDKE
jgi:hypothetical protein